MLTLYINIIAGNLVVAIQTEGQNNEDLIWSCDFSKDECGFTAADDKNFNLTWTLKSGQPGECKFSCNHEIKTCTDNFIYNFSNRILQKFCKMYLC